MYGLKAAWQSFEDNLAEIFGEDDASARAPQSQRHRNPGGYSSVSRTPTRQAPGINTRGGGGGVISTTSAAIYLKGSPAAAQGGANDAGDGEDDMLDMMSIEGLAVEDEVVGEAPAMDSIDDLGFEFVTKEELKAVLPPPEPIRFQDLEMASTLQAVSDNQCLSASQWKTLIKCVCTLHVVLTSLRAHLLARNVHGIPARTFSHVLARGRTPAPQRPPGDMCG